MQDEHRCFNELMYRIIEQSGMCEHTRGIWSIFLLEIKVYERRVMGKLRKLKDFWGMITIKLLFGDIRSTILRFASFERVWVVGMRWKMSRHTIQKWEVECRKCSFSLFITAMVFKQSSRVLQNLLFFHFAQFIFHAVSKMLFVWTLEWHIKWLRNCHVTCTIKEIRYAI